jgi:hypothetical protein
MLSARLSSLPRRRRPAAVILSIIPCPTLFILNDPFLEPFEFRLGPTGVSIENDFVPKKLGVSKKVH